MAAVVAAPTAALAPATTARVNLDMVAVPDMQRESGRLPTYVDVKSDHMKNNLTLRQRVSAARLQPIRLHILDQG